MQKQALVNADEREMLPAPSLEIIFLTCCITAYFSINQLSLCCVDNPVLLEDLCSIISSKMLFFFVFIIRFISSLSKSQLTTPCQSSS